MHKVLLPTAAGLLALAFTAPALAQSPCAVLQQGKIPTAAQWNQCFEAKQDVGGGGSGGTGAITGAQVIAALTYTPANKAGDTFTGKLVTVASASTGAGFNLPQGAAPTSPVNGDIWTTSAGLFVRINGATIGPIAPSGTGFALLASANTFTAENTFQATDIGRRTVNASGTLSITDNVVCGDVSGGAINLTLPPNPVGNGHTLSIDDCKRQAATHNLTVTANLGQTISGAASIIVSTNGGSINAVWNSTDNDWNLF